MIITFAGHSSFIEPEEIKVRLTTILENFLASYDYISFYCGGYGKFDLFCAKALNSLKEKHRNFEIIFVTPYMMTDAGRSKSFSLQLYDSILYPPLETVPKRFAINKRNEWMIVQADLVISYIDHEFGGAYKTFAYAKKKKKKIIELNKTE